MCNDMSLNIHKSLTVVRMKQTDGPHRGSSGVPFMNTITGAKLTSDLRRSVRLWHYTSHSQHTDWSVYSICI